MCADASEGADLQPLPRPLLLAVDSYSRWKASSSSRVRVAFPCHGLEALFSFDVCVSEAVPFIQAHCCRPSVHSRSALPVSTDTKLGRDKPFCFPCAFPLRVVVSSPAVLLPCCCRCLVYDHALPWLRWILLLPSAHRRRPLFQGYRAGFANLGGCAVNVRLPAHDQRARPVHGPVSGSGLGMRTSGQLAPSPAGRGGQCFSRWKGFGSGRGQHTSWQRVQGSQSTNRKARSCPSQDPRGCGWLVSSKVVLINTVCMPLYTRSYAYSATY